MNTSLIDITKPFWDEIEKIVQVFQEAEEEYNQIKLTVKNISMVIIN